MVKTACNFDKFWAI